MTIWTAATHWNRRRARLALACTIGVAATSGLLATVHTGSASAAPARQIEQLDRGLVAVPTSTGVLVSWRQFAAEVGQTSWHVYRNGQRLTPTTIADRTNYLDPTGRTTDRYAITPVIAGRVGTRSAEVQTWARGYLDIPLNKPAGGSTPSGAFQYRANDASVGDLDGDGQYEVIVKWDPTNQQDNSKPGYTGEVFLDAYKMNGTRLWRIGMGRNIRAGAHYTQFLVYDFDGDGRSEIVAKTADGTRDGRGTVIGNATVDHRNSTGYILKGPEFLTVFDGLTGAIRVTTNYDPPRGDMCLWGDCWGNRGDRFLAAVAYLDGGRPSIVMARGYYTRTVLVAYDFRDGRLTKRWTFDTNVAGRQYEGAGNHNLAVADVDGDGRDEIVYGSLTIDDNGRLLYATGLKHGDSLHVSDLNPARPGLEVFSTHEQSTSAYGMETHDARTGQILFGQRTGKDTGRGAAGDIDPRHPGAESWAVDGEWNSPTGWMFTAAGRLINNRIPAANHLVWWDGDLGREILDHNYNVTTELGVGTIGKWDPVNSRTVNQLTATGTYSNNSTKGNPSLQADLFGDWREEVLWRTQDSTALRLYATPYPSPHAFPTLMHDPVYRLGVAWQNVGYNQPPHTSYYLGNR